MDGASEKPPVVLEDCDEADEQRKNVEANGSKIDKVSVETRNEAAADGDSKKLEQDNSEISFKEFMDFLKTAYQIEGNVDTILKSEGMSDVVNWLQVKENNLIKPKEMAVQTSDANLGNVKKDIKGGTEGTCVENVENANIKMKLNEVLSEGILDSVLPYMIPRDAELAQKKITSKPNENPVNKIQATNEKMEKRLSNELLKAKIESEIEIHVCDEAKNVKKNFRCDQRLLVEKMGYFAEVTAGQRLDEMDISVHCDVGIFDWLMRWVKKESLTEPDHPQLEVGCAVPVLVSAAFLQMGPLLDECLLYCHEHMNEILKSSASLGCLNDAVVTRLAAMYTNVELESVRDRKDKIHSKLFCKMIQSLCEVEPEALRGHFSTMAKVYKCKYCQQLVNPLVEETVPCVPHCTSIQLDGAIVSKHYRDSNWTLTDHVATYHLQLKTWRKVYWRLWGDAHFLFCLTCKRHFPARQIRWCKYHPDPAQFFTTDAAQRVPLPIGRYPCCGERAYRFQILDDFSGCQFRDHEVCTKDTKDAAVYELLMSLRPLIEEEPPKLMFPERLTRLVARDASKEDDGELECKEEMWWEGIEIVPPRPNLGLLGFLDTSDESDQEITTQSTDDICSDDEYISLSSSNCSDTDSAGSEECLPKPTNKKVKKIRKKKRDSRIWQTDLSIRNNQDKQRSHEEAAMKDITAILQRRTGNTKARAHSSYKLWSKHVTPPGGVWVRLESEWRNTVTGPSKKQTLAKQKSRK